jgi:hypothetical protein
MCSQCGPRIAFARAGFRSEQPAGRAELALERRERRPQRIGRWRSRPARPARRGARSDRDLRVANSPRCEPSAAATPVSRIARAQRGGDLVHERVVDPTPGNVGDSVRSSSKMPSLGERAPAHREPRACEAERRPT